MSPSDDADSQSHGEAQAAVQRGSGWAGARGPRSQEEPHCFVPTSLCEPEDWDAPGSLCFPILGEKVKELQPAALENGLR